MIIAPPQLHTLQAGTKLRAGLTESTILADFDFETYSPAGFVWNPTIKKWGALRGANKKGLSAVGAARYVEHEDAEVLSLAYDLKDGQGPRLWNPCDQLPVDLFAHLQSGGLLEAWNVRFEYLVWTRICQKKYGFPPIDLRQLRCAMAKARAFALPGKLSDSGEVLNCAVQKNKSGARLLKLFSIPRDPTIKDKRTRIYPEDMLIEASELYQYNLDDIKAEAEISSRIPDLSPFELEFWQCDQIINERGVQVDVTAINNAIKIIEAAYVKYNKKLQEITNGEVKAASEVPKLLKWINSHKDVKPFSSLDADTVETRMRACNLPNDVFQALEIRQIIGAASVKKLYAMANQLCEDGRLRDLFAYHSARTGRATGNGPQPQNLPNSGPGVEQCEHCQKYYGINVSHFTCLWCGKTKSSFDTDWNADAAEHALEVINTGSLSALEFYFDNPIEAISGCLRSLFISKPGYDLICSDYSAIEAVVLAELAGESWRQEVFRTHGKIYEMSASKITGIPFEEYERHKKSTGNHHPTRKTVGKVAELASGYQGWIGAWKNFGADEFFTDDQIKESILAWRKASPAIVEFWGGQEKNWTPQLYGIEGAAISAVINQGTQYECRGIKFIVKNNIMYCTLLSGRNLVYHQPQINPALPPRRGLSLSYMGWNTNPKMGDLGWVRMNTYGGKLVENIVQATARDILAYAIVNLERAGYAVVLHVHDEIVAEVLASFGSLEEFETIMSTMPEWAKGWPVKASGGWRGKRYRK